MTGAWVKSPPRWHFSSLKLCQLTNSLKEELLPSGSKDQLKMCKKKPCTIQITAWLAMCGHTSTSCDVQSLVAMHCGTNFGSNLWCVCVCGVISGLGNVTAFFGNNERYEDWILLSFNVSYTFVAEKNEGF